MMKEFVFSGIIYCENLTLWELESQLQNEILSKIGSAIKNQVEIHFGPKLYERLCDEEILGLHSHTIAAIPCCLSYNIAPYTYKVYLRHDHEDQIDSMTALFQADVKRQLNAAFEKSSVPIDISGKIKKVIFNPPATIIFWKDGSKTVVKCNGEAFAPEKGMAMAISRKVLGDSYDYYNVFEKWCKKYKQPGKRSGKYPWGTTPQEIAAKYMPLPKTESGDSDAD